MSRLMAESNSKRRSATFALVELLVIIAIEL
jgi:Tfp pilus assembly protein FimT